MLLSVLFVVAFRSCHSSWT